MYGTCAAGWLGSVNEFTRAPRARTLRVTAAVAAMAVGLSATTTVPAQAGLPVELPQARAAYFAFEEAANLPVGLAEDLVAFFPFDETAGTIVNDRSGNGNNAAIVNSNAGTVWNNGRGLTLPGGNGGTAPAVRLPDSLLSGLSDVTIAYDIRLSSATQQGPVFAFGRTADNGGYLTATPGAGTTRHTASIAGPGASPVSQTVGGPVALPANTWKHVTVTVKGGDAVTPGQMVLYEDGVRVDSTTALTLKPADITSAISFIGRSSTAAGQQFRGKIKDFRIYSKELTASQVLALSNDTAPGNLAEDVAIGEPGRHQRGDEGHRPARRARHDVGHQRRGRGHGAGRGHPSGGRPGGCAGHADGHLHPPRADGHQDVPDHGQATRGDPAGSAGDRPRALLQARRGRRDHPGRLRHARARPATRRWSTRTRQR